MARAQYKNISTVGYTPTAGSLQSMPGITGLNLKLSCDVSQTIVADATRPDNTIVLKYVESGDLETEDVGLVDFSTIMTGVIGALTFKNVAASAAAVQKTYSIANVTITGIDYGLKSGSGPQTAKITFVTHSADGSTCPVSRT